MDACTMRKNVIWNAVGNVTYLMFQWVITVLVTVIGGFEDAGLLSLTMSLTATFQTLAMFGIRQFQVSDIENKYTDTCYVALRCWTCLLSLICCIAVSMISNYWGKRLLAITLFMLFRLAESLSDVLHGIAQKNGRLDIAGKSFTAKGIGIFVCFLAGYWFTRNLNFGIFLMAAFSTLILLVYDIPAVRKLSDFHIVDSVSHCVRLASETLPLCAYLFLYTALSTLPKLILEKKCGGELLGAYASIFAPALLLQIATGYIYNPFATRFAELLQDRDKKGFHSLIVKICLSIAGISAAVIVAAQFLGEFALVLVFGEQIRDYVYLLNPILILNFAFSYFGFFCMIAIVMRKFKWLLTSVGVGTVLTVVLSEFLIDRSGANGASYALILALAVGFVILLIGIFGKGKKQECQK